jgi:hypothetical protein
VLDGCGKPGLAYEALAKAVVLGKLGCKYLQSSSLAQMDVLCEEDDPHSTPAQQAFDPMACELVTLLRHRHVVIQTGALRRHHSD